MLKRNLTNAEEIRQLGVEVFGSEESFLSWCLIGHDIFSGKAPIYHIFDSEGQLKIKEELENIARGDLS